MHFGPPQSPRETTKPEGKTEVQPGKTGGKLVFFSFCWEKYGKMMT